MSVAAKSIVASLALVSLALPAHASSSGWFETEGGRVRLVTTGLPDAAGRLRGILDIDLKPGWKTYWRDPGDAGVPPTIDMSRSTNVSSAELDFPAPARHVEIDFTWAGYDRPVGLPVTIQAAKAGDAVQFDADVFLGICETICIPVKAELVLDPAGDPDNQDDAALVKAAFDALPAQARADFSATVLGRDGGELIVQAKVPGDAARAELFIAGNQDYSFGTPVRTDRDGKILFSFDIFGPDAAPAGTILHYTLVGADGAVSGLLSGF